MLSLLLLSESCSEHQIVQNLRFFFCCVLKFLASLILCSYSRLPTHDPQALDEHQNSTKEKQKSSCAHSPRSLSRPRATHRPPVLTLGLMLTNSGYIFIYLFIFFFVVVFLVLDLLPLFFNYPNIHPKSIHIHPKFIQINKQTNQTLSNNNQKCTPIFIKIL